MKKSFFLSPSGLYLFSVLLIYFVGRYWSGESEELSLLGGLIIGIFFALRSLEHESAELNAKLDRQPSTFQTLITKPPA
jgi:hypothetical protein